MTASDPFDLDRFVRAQDDGGVYDRALAELRRGRKTSHWMWFVFPQIAGLGTSATSRHYAIATLDEARAYLRHPVLGPRLRECMETVVAHSGRSATDIFGSIDAQKLHSSATLFLRADPGDNRFAEVLASHFAGAPDAATDRILGSGPPPPG